MLALFAVGDVYVSQKALLKLRRRAQSSSAMQQLTAQIPEAELFLQGAFDKGE